MAEDGVKVFQSPKESLTLNDYPIILSLGSGIEKQEGNEQKNQDTCVMCKFWAGHCRKGHIGRLACSDACESFQKRE
jgi:hypothetical protein